MLQYLYCSTALFEFQNKKNCSPPTYKSVKNNKFLAKYVLKLPQGYTGKVKKLTKFGDEQYILYQNTFLAGNSKQYPSDIGCKLLKFLYRIQYFSFLEVELIWFANA